MEMLEIDRDLSDLILFCRVIGEDTYDTIFRVLQDRAIADMEDYRNGVNDIE